MYKIIFLLLSFAITTSAQAMSSEELDRAVKAAGGIEIFVKKLVQTIASSLPMRVNQNWEVSQVVGIGKRIRYQSRFLQVENRASIDDMNAFKSANINYAACSMPMLSDLIKEYGVVFTYSVLSRNSEFLYEYELNSKTCKGR
jgi:hypothetical protein